MRESSCFRDFIKYSSLNVLGMIALSCYILADTFFVSKALGANGLTALNLAIPVYNFINGSGLMIGMGGGTKYSIFKSQGKMREADRHSPTLQFSQPYLPRAFSFWDFLRLRRSPAFLERMKQFLR